MQVIKPMETLEIRVPDKQKAQQIVEELEKRTDIASVRFVPTRPLPSRKKAGREVDEITLVNEASLAKDWLSPQDDHWDNVYSTIA